MTTTRLTPIRTTALTAALLLTLTSCAPGSADPVVSASPAAASPTASALPSPAPSATPSPTPTPAETEEHDAPLDVLLTTDDVCAGLRSAWWDNDPSAVEPFVSLDFPTDTLFSVTWDPASYNDTSFAGETCILGGIDDVGVIEIGGDGHVGANAYAITWHDSSWYDDDANWALYVSGLPGADSERDPEVFLQTFAEAWAMQDADALGEIATDEVINTVLEAGAGEVSIVWDEDLCTDDMGGGTRMCEALFMPEGQTECCSQIWNIEYWFTPQNYYAVVGLTFGGDAG